MELDGVSMLDTVRKERPFRVEIFKPSSVCSREIQFDIIDGKLSHLAFQGGCPGNNLGIIALVEGMPVDDVIEKLKGLPCGSKDTSCPDQLTIALRDWKNKHSK